MMSASSFLYVLILCLCDRSTLSASFLQSCQLIENSSSCYLPLNLAGVIERYSFSYPFSSACVSMVSSLLSASCFPRPH